MAHGLFLYCGRLLVAAVLGLGRWLYRLEIVGAENIPAHGACVLVGNHASYMDFILAAFIVRSRPNIHMYSGGGMFRTEGIRERQSCSEWRE